MIQSTQYSVRQHFLSINPKHYNWSVNKIMPPNFSSKLFPFSKINPEMVSRHVVKMTTIIHEGKFDLIYVVPGKCGIGSWVVAVSDWWLQCVESFVLKVNRKPTTTVSIRVKADLILLLNWEIHRISRSIQATCELLMYLQAASWIILATKPAMET